jgi:ABC-2 type transport system ATP-binding protein
VTTAEWRPRTLRTDTAAPQPPAPFGTVAPMAGAAIVADKLERSFGDFKAVRGVSLQVEEGEIYGCLGPNGAGKSTSVRMLCTLLRPTGGRASVAGFDVVTQAEEVRLRIGVAVQEVSIDPKMTGREFLLLQGKLYGLRGKELDGRMGEVFSLVKLDEALDRPVGTYSGGMKRRVDLAGALIHNPSVLFLDEPTTGLDPASRADVWAEVRRLNQEIGMTIFLTTQYLEEADELADRVGIIDKGRVVAEGTPAELKRSVGNDLIEVKVNVADAERAALAVRRITSIEEVTVTDGLLSVRTSDAAAALSTVAVVLNSAGVAVTNLTMRTPSLDDVFLAKTGDRMEEEAEPEITLRDLAARLAVLERENAELRRRAEAAEVASKARA